MGTCQNQTGKSRSPAHVTRCHVCATRPVCIMGYVGEATAQALAGVIHEHPFRKSELLQVEGELSDHIAIVKLGTVEAIRQGVDGIEAIDCRHGDSSCATGLAHPSSSAGLDQPTGRKLS